mmetsp:Transcript_31161/g.82936  ORF Transcript_31161/g.82936 Transcript_31161/m.82936 type:complete len:285 (-) Transcript_31161:585-1439(-)
MVPAATVSKLDPASRVHCQGRLAAEQSGRHLQHASPTRSGSGGGARHKAFRHAPRSASNHHAVASRQHLIQASGGHILASRVLLFSELASEHAVCIAYGAITQREILGLGGETLRRSQRRLLAITSFSELRPKALHELRVSHDRVPLEDVAENRRHRSHRSTVRTSAVRCALVVLATRNQLYISRAVARVVIFLPRTLVQHERKIKPCTTVTTIHDRRKLHPRLQRGNQHVKHLVVHDHPRRLKVTGTNRLIHPILFRAVGVLLLRAVARVVKEKAVTRLCVLH